MLERFWKWIGDVLAEHTVMQIIAAVPIAYLAGLGMQMWRGAEALLDAVPPLFWPILAVLVLIVTVYHGFIAPIVRFRRGREQAYWDLVDGAYQMVSQAYRPKILNPEHPGNPHAMREYAQNEVDRLRPQMIARRGAAGVPAEIDVTEDNSLRDWYHCLRRERARRPYGG